MFTKQSLFLKKHARRVLICKHALPVFAFLLTTIMIAWPLLTPEKERFDLPLQKGTVRTPSVDMEKIHFLAKDDKNHTMTVSADTVKEVDRNAQIAKLDKPIGTYILADGDILTSKTDYGLAYQQEKYFLFNQPITTTSKSGYVAHTQNVTASYEGVLDSDSEIKISGPSGAITAQGFHLSDKGNLIDFKGNVTGKIKQNQNWIHINTQDGLKLNRAKQTLTGHKNVKIQQQSNTLTADTVILYYTEDKSNRIKKIQAIGHVIVDNGKNKITGEKGTYNPLTEEMEMSENVRLYQGKSFVTTDKALLNMKTGESRLQNNSNGARIKGILLPDDLKKQGEK